MSKEIRKYLVRTAVLCGGLHITKYLVRKTPIVLMYHRFSGRNEDRKVCKDEFENQLIEIKDNFQPTSLTSICNSITRDSCIPENAVVITIDDGYYDFYQFAYPILKKHQIPATIYITADFIDQKIWLWPDKIEYILKNTKENALNIKINGITLKEKKENKNDIYKIWSKCVEIALGISDKEKWLFIDKLAYKLNTRVPELPTAEYLPLNWEQIKEMHENGIDIGAHTLTHPVLTNVTDEQLVREIINVKAIIENKLNTSVYNFCYPNGTENDYSEKVKRYVKKAQYLSATTAFHDQYLWNDLYEIRRYAVGNEFSEFKKVIYGMRYLSDLISRSWKTRF